MNAKQKKLKNPQEPLGDSPPTLQKPELALVLEMERLGGRPLAPLTSVAVGLAKREEYRGLNG